MLFTKRLLNFLTLLLFVSVIVTISCDRKDRLDPNTLKQQEKLAVLGYNFTEKDFIDAVKKGKLDVVTLFLEGGMSPDTTVKTGNYDIPVIFYAMENKNEEIVKLLAHKGASLNIMIGGVTVIMKAVEKAEVPTLETLIEKGADVNKPGENGLTPLMIAIEQGNDGAVWLLLKSKAAVNAKDRHGITPLMRAVREGNVDLVKELIRKGADINAQSNKGLKVYKMIGEKNKEALEILLEEAKPDEKKK